MIGKHASISSFALCFLAPLLNALAEKIKKENFERLLVTMLLLFSVIPTITTYDIMQDSGKGLVDFVMIYLIGRFCQNISKTKLTAPMPSLFFCSLTGYFDR